MEEGCRVPADVFSLTVTLNWDTEMLFGWTLRRTHCLMSDAKRRGSDERSHFSFLVHLRGKKQTKNKTREGVLFIDDKCTHTHTSLVTRPGFNPFHLLAPGKKGMFRRSRNSWTHLSYFFAVHYLQWLVNGNHSL